VKTVILLIDFKGHPALGSEYLNNRRYAEVQKILTDTQIDRYIMNIESLDEQSYNIQSDTQIDR